MKKISVLDTFIVVAVLLSIHNTGRASYTLNLVDHIETEPNYPAESKPTLHYPKYALVTFITDKRDRVSFSCNDGWIMKNNVCEVNPCTGYPYTKEETANCKVTDMCRSGDIMKYKCTKCEDGLEPDGKGGCICNSSNYPYNTKTSPCMYQYDTSAGSCTHVDSSGKTTVYYKDCLCPAGWMQCLDLLHHVGVGNKCVSGGEDYYASCKCDSDYSKTCVGVEIENPNDYCIAPLSGQTFYRECFSCDISKNEIHEKDRNNFWCDGLGWIDFETIHGFYLNRGE